MVTKDKILNDIIKEVSEEFQLPIGVVEKIYASQWEFMKERIEKLPLAVIDEKGFSKLKTNFNIPNIGKFFTNYKRIEHVREKIKESKRVRDSS